MKTSGRHDELLNIYLPKCALEYIYNKRLQICHRNFRLFYRRLLRDMRSITLSNVSFYRKA